MRGFRLFFVVLLALGLAACASWETPPPHYVPPQEKAQPASAPAQAVPPVQSGQAKQAEQAALPEKPAQAEQVAQTEQAAKPDDGLCVSAWTYAPGNFVLDVAEGADVFLMPDVQDFPLFCTPAKAREGLNSRIAKKELPEANGGWAIFRVEGEFHDIAKPVGLGNYILSRQSRLVDWEP